MTSADIQNQAIRYLDDFQRGILKGFEKSMGLFGKKKLKRIPYDVVSYILIEAETIKDANDKQMISSYCLGKLEKVNWYLELLEQGSTKYIVPQNKAQLETLRDQLMAAHKTIMATKIPDPRKRPIIDIDYPEGYEG